MIHFWVMIAKLEVDCDSFLTASKLWGALQYPCETP